MRFALLASTAALAASVCAAPPPSDHVLHERRSHLSPSWSKKFRIDGDMIVPVRIGMTPSNSHLGHDLLMEVSEHTSPKYGKHYTEEEVIELFSPSEETVDVLREWLETAGIAKERVSQSFNKQWLQFDSAVHELESLLRTQYHAYGNKHHDNEHVACDEYSVPAHVQPHVDYITPGITLMKTSGVGKRALGKRDGTVRYKNPPLLKSLPSSIAPGIAGGNGGDLSLCESVISPPCIRALYNITENSNPAMADQLGIFEDLGDHYSQADLNSFFKASDSGLIPQGTHPILKAIDGATGPIENSEAGPESNLDFSISYPIIYPSDSVLFQTDDDVTEDDYIYRGFLNNLFDAIDGSYCSFHAFGAGPSPLDPPYPDLKPGGYKGQRQCGSYKPTNVVSISYGGAEVDLPARYQKRQCDEIMKLGLRGISVVVSSGDYGVAISPGDPSPNGCLPASRSKNGTIFAPDFPATCPYITSLGSTFLPPGGDVTKDEEIATTRFASGGGFSNVYPIPNYQKSAVTGYLSKYPPPYPSYQTVNGTHIGANGGIFNSIGRGFPDFSAIGDNVLIYYRGRPVLIGGTSAAAPTFAAILGRINMERINAGKGSVGFVNPTLYANPQVLHDITKGSNPGCGTKGFSVEPGWDPVTGMGTPNYPKMLSLFMSLP